MTAKYASIDEYMEQQPEPQASLLKELRSLILEAVPDAEETFNYGVPAFALVKGGKAARQVMMGAFRNHIGLYPHPAVIEHFSDELSEYKQGKGSVQFALDRKLPGDLIIRMIRFRKDMLDGK